ASRGFSGDVGDNLRALAAYEVGCLGIVEDFAPGPLESNDGPFLSLGHFGDSVRKEAIREDRYFRTGLDEVADGCFHSCATSARDRDREGIRGAKDRLKKITNILSDLEEKRIKVADDGLRHHVVYARMNLRGTRTEEESLGWAEGSEALRRHRCIHMYFSG